MIFSFTPLLECMPVKIGLIILFSLFLSACNPSFYPFEEQVVEPVQYVEVVITSNPGGTATSTPFQPLPPTNTPLPSPTPLATATPRPTKRPPTETPWVSNAELPEGQRKILILGSDSRGDGGFRTDVILLLILNPQQGTASAVSFPRDLYVNIPGVGQDRINTAMVYGGFSLLAATFEANFGVRPDSYVLTNFDGFVEIVNNLGGIDVNAAASLTDKCDLPQANWDGYCTVEPGMINMDGKTALWYVRARYTTSDFDRTRREQEVLRAIFDKLLSLDAVSRAPELYDLYRRNVEISLSLNDITSLIAMAPQLAESGRIRRYTIGPGQVWDYMVPGSGARVLLQNEPAIRSIIYEALAP